MVGSKGHGCNGGEADGKVPCDGEALRNNTSEKSKLGAAKGLPRARSLPAMRNGDWGELRSNVRSLARTLRSMRASAQNLVTLNIEPNSCGLCPHKYSCPQNAVYKGLFRSFAAGYGFKAILSFMTAAMSGKLGTKGRTLNDIFWGKDALRFGTFTGVMSFLYKVIVCSLRRALGKKSPYIHGLAGFVAGAAILFDDPSRRSSIALYCVVRALADLYQNLKFTKQVRRVPKGSAILFTLAQIPIMFSFVKCPGLMSKGYHRWILKMGNAKADAIRRTCRSVVTNGMHRVAGETWGPCQYHKGPCLTYNAMDWFLGLARAARIYAPVHLLPTLLFNPMRLLAEPKTVVLQKLGNVVRSSVFLTTYQFNAKASLCTLRNLWRDDPSWQAVLAGFFSGLSIFLEKDYRRTELTLYVLPRALEICFNYFLRFQAAKKGFIQNNIPGLSVFGFQCAMAVWMFIRGNPNFPQMNGLNERGLRAVFGSRL